MTGKSRARAKDARKADSKKRAAKAVTKTATGKTQRVAARPAARPRPETAVAEPRGEPSGTPVAAVRDTRRPLKPSPGPAARARGRRATLTPAQLQHFRSLLLERHRELTQAYAVSKDDSRSRLDDGTEDYIDYAVSSYAREFLLSLTELDRKQLVAVEDALRRLARGDYGSCQHCGIPIDRKRLEVAPWAENCLRCQELEEQGLLAETAPRPGDQVGTPFEEYEYAADESEAGEVEPEGPGEEEDEIEPDLVTSETEEEPAPEDDLGVRDEED
jgi:DnaK suppressor protein